MFFFVLHTASAAGGRSGDTTEKTKKSCNPKDYKTFSWHAVRDSNPRPSGP